MRLANCQIGSFASRDEAKCPVHYLLLMEKPMQHYNSSKNLFLKQIFLRFPMYYRTCLHLLYQLLPNPSVNTFFVTLINEAFQQYMEHTRLPINQPSKLCRFEGI